MVTLGGAISVGDVESSLGRAAAIKNDTIGSRATGCAGCEEQYKDEQGRTARHHFLEETFM
jgi:hypothetical protein